MVMLPTSTTSNRSDESFLASIRGSSSPNTSAAEAEWRRRTVQHVRHRSHSLANPPSNLRWERVRTVGLSEEAQSHESAQLQVHGFWSRCWWNGQGWLLAIGIGILSAISGIIIEIATRILSSTRFGFCSELPFAGEQWCSGGAWKPWGDGFIAFVANVGLGVVMAIISAWLCHAFAPAACGSGIPEVKTVLNGFVLPDVLSGRTLSVKIPGLALSVAAGMALGKEGPLVHVAVCWAQLLSSIFPQFQNEGKRRELISAAAAAGVSTAFGAPLGGVLFSLEEVSSHFPRLTLLRAFTAAIVAALVLRLGNLTGTGRLTIFSVRQTSSLHPDEFILFILLGVIGGLVGAAFNALNSYWSSIRMRLTFRRRVHPVAEVAIIAFVTLLSSWPVALLRPLNADSIHAMFDSCDPDSLDVWKGHLGLCTSSGEYAPADIALIGSLATAAAVRFFQMVLTFGTACPAGLFVPSLFIGACFGRCAGVILRAANEDYNIVARDVEPGVYAMVGAAAVLGGVCRVTISLVVIMLELTGDLTDAVPFMLAILTAKLVGDVLNEGIYDLYIVLKGYPFLSEEPDISFTERLCDIMESDLTKLDIKSRLSDTELRTMLERFSFSGFPVVNGCNFVGYVRRSKLQELLANSFSGNVSDTISPDDILSLVDQSIMRMVPDAPLSQAHKVFQQLGLRYIFVVGSSGTSGSAAQDMLQGMISRKNYIRFLKSGRVGHMPNHPKSVPSGHALGQNESGVEPLFSARQGLVRRNSRNTIRRDDIREQDTDRPHTPSSSSLVSLREVIDSARRENLLADNGQHRAYTPESLSPDLSGDEETCNKRNSPRTDSSAAEAVSTQ